MFGALRALIRNFPNFGNRGQVKAALESAKSRQSSLEAKRGGMVEWFIAPVLKTQIRPRRNLPPLVA
jgi:hypothetical protein